MKRVLFMIVVLCLGNNTAQANLDTLLVYDLTTGQESRYPLPAYDTTITADSLPPGFGILGVTAVPNIAPTDTYPGYRISRFVRASDYYEDFNFPFTAVVSIKAGFNIVGSVIGPRAILVSVYDVVQSSTPYIWRFPSSIKPFFDNATIHFGNTELTKVRYYVPSTRRSDDFAIIEVAENVGELGGYFGLAFDSSSSIYDGRRMLYNLSYPLSYPYGANYNGYYPNDTANGDTLYMKYGYATQGAKDRIDFLDGWNGEFVAPFFDDGYHVRAMRWSNQYCPIMTAQRFYFLKDVLSIIPTGMKEIEENDMVIYPNPSAAGCQLSVASQLVGGNLEVYNANGSVVFQSKISNLKSEISLPVPAGVYFVHISSERGSVVKKLIRL